MDVAVLALTGLRGGVFGTVGYPRGPMYHMPPALPRNPNTARVHNAIP